MKLKYKKLLYVAQNFVIRTDINQQGFNFNVANFFSKKLFSDWNRCQVPKRGKLFRLSDGLKKDGKQLKM